MRISKLKKLLCLSLLPIISLMCLGLTSVSADTDSREDVEVVNLNDLAPFKDRTVDEIATKYYKTMVEEFYNAQLNDADNLYVPGKIPQGDHGPYSGGELKPEVHKSLTDMVNYYRWLAGLQPMKGVSEHVQGLQDLAILESIYRKQTGTISHHLWDEKNFNKPADMSEEFWHKGTTQSNQIISWGLYPQQSIENFLWEGYDLDKHKFTTTGHIIYILLKSSTNGLNYGYYNNILVGDMKEVSAGNGTVNLPMYTFPVPGLNPRQAVLPSKTAWTAWYGNYVLANEDKAKVTVTKLSNGEVYEATKANHLLETHAFDGNIHLIFRQPVPEKDGYYHSDYKVRVEGLCDRQTRKPKIVEYTVKFVDITPYANYKPTSVYRVNLADGNAFNNDVLYIQPSSDLGEQVDNDTIISLLPELKLVTASGYKQTLKPEWKLVEKDNETLTFEVVGYNHDDLDKNVNDRLNKIIGNRVKVRYWTSDTSKKNHTAIEGSTGIIALNPTKPVVPGSVKWYHVTKDGQVEEVKNNTTATLTIKDVKLTDAGKYFAIYDYAPVRGGVTYAKQTYVTAYKELSVVPKEVKSAEVKNLTKTTVPFSENPDLTGSTIFVNFVDGTTEEVPLTMDYIQGFNPRQLGEQTAQVVYRGQKINVKFNVVPKAYDKFEFINDMKEKTYKQGHDLDTEGMLLKVYFTDGTSETVAITPDMIKGFDNQTVGTQQLSVLYQDKQLDLPYTIEMLPDPARLLQNAKDKANKDIAELKQLTKQEVSDLQKAIASADTVEAVNALLVEPTKLNDSREKALSSIDKLKQLKANEIKNAKVAVQNAKTVAEVNKALLDAKKLNQGRQDLVDTRVHALKVLNSIRSKMDQNAYNYVTMQLQNAKTIAAINNMLDQVLAEQSNKNKPAYKTEREKQLAAYKEKINALPNLSAEDKKKFNKQLDETKYYENFEIVLKKAKEKSKAIADGEVVVDDNNTTEKPNNGETVVGPEKPKELIVNIPSQKVVVANPKALTQAEKNAIVQSIRKANPNLPKNTNIQVTAFGSVIIDANGYKNKAIKVSNLVKLADNKIYNISYNDQQATVGNSVTANIQVANNKTLPANTKFTLQTNVSGLTINDKGQLSFIAEKSQAASTVTAKVLVTYPDNTTVQLTVNFTVEKLAEEVKPENPSANTDNGTVVEPGKDVEKTENGSETTNPEKNNNSGSNVDNPKPADKPVVITDNVVKNAEQPSLEVVNDHLDCFNNFEIVLSNLDETKKPNVLASMPADLKDDNHIAYYFNVDVKKNGQLIHDLGQDNEIEVRVNNLDLPANITAEKIKLIHFNDIDSKYVAEELPLASLNVQGKYLSFKSNKFSPIAVVLPVVNNKEENGANENGADNQNNVEKPDNGSANNESGSNSEDGNGVNQPSEKPVEGETNEPGTSENKKPEVGNNDSHESEVKPNEGENTNAEKPANGSEVKPGDNSQPEPGNTVENQTSEKPAEGETNEPGTSENKKPEVGNNDSHESEVKPNEGENTNVDKPANGSEVKPGDNSQPEAGNTVENQPSEKPVEGETNEPGASENEKPKVGNNDSHESEVKPNEGENTNADKPANGSEVKPGDNSQPEAGNTVENQPSEKPVEGETNEPGASENEKPEVGNNDSHESEVKPNEGENTNADKPANGSEVKPGDNKQPETGNNVNGKVDVASQTDDIEQSNKDNDSKPSRDQSNGSGLGLNNLNNNQDANNYSNKDKMLPHTGETNALNAVVVMLISVLTIAGLRINKRD